MEKESSIMPQSNIQTLSIIQPDDWHLHLRDGDVLQRKRRNNIVNGYWMHCLATRISNH